MIVSDNGSTDGSVDKIRAHPSCSATENRANLRLPRATTLAFAMPVASMSSSSTGHTVHDGSLDRWIEFADIHPEAGPSAAALNLDGYQRSARPFHHFP